MTPYIDPCHSDILWRASHNTEPFTNSVTSHKSIRVVFSSAPDPSTHTDSFINCVMRDTALFRPKFISHPSFVTLHHASFPRRFYTLLRDVLRYATKTWFRVFFFCFFGLFVFLFFGVAKAVSLFARPVWLHKGKHVETKQRRMRMRDSNSATLQKLSFFSRPPAWFTPQVRRERKEKKYHLRVPWDSRVNVTR